MKRKNEAEPPQAQAPSFRLADPTRELRNPSPYEEKRMQNIARNQEILRDIFEGKGSPATSFKANIKRKNEAEPPQAQAPSFRLADPTRELRNPSPYEEKRMQNIARNQEILRDIFEGKGSPATSFKADIKRKKEVESPQAQAPSFRLADPTCELRKQSSYEEERYSHARELRKQSPNEEER